MRKTLKGAVQKSKKPACSLEAVNNSVLEAKIKCVLQFAKKIKLSPKSPADSVGKVNSI